MINTIDEVLKLVEQKPDYKEVTHFGFMQLCKPVAGDDWRGKFWRWYRMPRWPCSFT